MANCKKCHKEMQDTPYCPWCGAKQSVQRTKRGNGLGSAYKRGSTWVASVTVGSQDGKQLRRRKYGFKTKKEALEYIPILANAPIIKPRTLKYYYDSWESNELEQLSKSKQTAYKIAWKKIEPLHNWNVKDLTIIQLRDYVLEVAPTHYPARDIKTLLSHLFKLAIADQQISVNMSEYINLPKLEESEREPWNEDELKKMWERYEAGDKMASYLLLMTYTGMMPGELFLCEKSMVNIEKQEIVNAGIKTDVRKKTPIGIPEFLIPVIETIFTFTPDDYPKLVRRDRDTFYKDYHEFLKINNIRDLPMYTCRHTTATALAVGNNIAPSVIQKAMRHAKFTTTQRYIHPDISDVKTALNTLIPNGDTPQ